MPEKDPKILTPEQTARVHHAVIVALIRGMGGRLVMRIPAQNPKAAIVTTATDIGNGRLDIELVLMERHANVPG